MKKLFETVEEIRANFIQRGWGKNTSFTEVTLEEAKEEGLYFAVQGIKNGKKYFRMNVSGNIYKADGSIVYYNVAG